MKITKVSGQVVHRREFMGDDDLQVDTFIVNIPVDCLSNKGTGKLQEWCVEEMDRAYIDWAKGTIVLEYTTEHYLTKDYVEEYGVEEFEEVV